MGAISLLNQIYKQKTADYGELDVRAKEIEAKNEAKMYKETPLRKLEIEKKQLERKITAIKKRFGTDSNNWEIKKKMQAAIAARKTEIEAKLISVEAKEATQLIIGFQKWWPKEV